MKVIIFCGGHGTRLWPVSRKSTPKPFVPLVNGKSFFQITYERYRKHFSPEEIFISTEDIYVSYVKKQAPDLPRKNIIAEPERKDTLGACGLATTIVNKYYPGESVLISWAKHLISKESLFLNAVFAAGDYADKTGLMVSIDSVPSYPSIHNGWIKTGKVLEKINNFKIFELERHIEKPELEIAEKLFESKEWAINTGYKVWKTDVMLKHYKQYQPDMYKRLMKISDAWGTKKQNKVLAREYSKFKKDSIEYGILERIKGNIRATITIDMGWEDIGISWELFYKTLITKSRTTVVEGGVDYLPYESENNLIIGPKGKLIGVVGLSNVAVIDTPTGLLVCPLDKTAKVKSLYAEIEDKYDEYTE